MSIGDDDIDEHGFCWALSKSPVIDSTSIQLGPQESKGVFSSTISDLESKSIYYVRAYVSTLSGTEYGEEMLSTARKLIWKHLFEIKPELKDYHCNYNAADGIVEVISKKSKKGD